MRYIPTALLALKYPSCGSELAAWRLEQTWDATAGCGPGTSDLSLDPFCVGVNPHVLGFRVCIQLLMLMHGRCLLELSCSMIPHK